MNWPDTIDAIKGQIPNAAAFGDERADCDELKAELVANPPANAAPSLSHTMTWAQAWDAINAALDNPSTALTMSSGLAQDMLTMPPPEGPPDT